MINNDDELAQVHQRHPYAVPSGRVAEPEEIVEIALYLCTPTANCVTGRALMAGGGFTSFVKL